MIQNGYRIDCLPMRWKTEDWPTLLILCRDYYNSLHPNGPLTKKENHTGDSGFATKQDRLTHQKKVRTWFLDPVKFKREIDAEQRRHAGKCIYHLVDNHPTMSCNVKLECDKLVADKKSSVLVSSSSGQLRHITEEQYEDAVTDEPSNSMSEEPCNDTSDASLHYFARVRNHYLRLVKSSSPVHIRHTMQYPIIVDNGANFHMFCALDFFESITPMSGKVILGDGKTTLDIHGIGTVKLCFGNQSLCLENVRCVPDLAESIYSLFIHIQSPGCAVHSSYDDGLSIIFPEFITKALIGYNDIYLNATPKPKLSGSQPLNSSGDNSHHSDIASTLCCHMSDFQCALTSESTKVDNILHRLHQYYQDVKTRRQLDLEVPAGFRQQSNHQRLLSIHPVPVVENISSGDAP
jgi:hypothetical protein